MVAPLEDRVKCRLYENINILIQLTKRQGLWMFQVHMKVLYEYQTQCHLAEILWLNAVSIIQPFYHSLPINSVQDG